MKLRGNNIFSPVAEHILYQYVLQFVFTQAVCTYTHGTYIARPVSAGIFEDSFGVARWDKITRQIWGPSGGEWTVNRASGSRGYSPPEGLFTPHSGSRGFSTNYRCRKSRMA